MLALLSLSLFNLLGPDHVAKASYLERLPNLTNLLLGELSRCKDLAQLLLSICREARNLLLCCSELAGEVHFLGFDVFILVFLRYLKQYSVLNVCLFEVLPMLCFVLVAFGKEVSNYGFIALGQRGGFRLNLVDLSPSLSQVRR